MSPPGHLHLSQSATASYLGLLSHECKFTISYMRNTVSRACEIVTCIREIVTRTCVIVTRTHSSGETNSWCLPHNSIRYVSAALLIGFTVVLTPTRSAVLPICSVPAQQICRTYISADVTAIQVHLDKSCTEQQHNIWSLFKIKQSVLTPAHKSQKKRQIQALLLILEQLCDYRENYLVLRCQLSTVLRCGVHKTQPVGGAARQSKTWLEP